MNDLKIEQKFNDLWIYENNIVFPKNIGKIENIWR